jgi:hypothetical protein
MVDDDLKLDVTEAFGGTLPNEPSGDFPHRKPQIGGLVALVINALLPQEANVLGDNQKVPRLLWRSTTE